MLPLWSHVMIEDFAFVWTRLVYFLSYFIVVLDVLPTLKMDQDTSKLKKNITSMIDRLNKGGSLSGSPRTSKNKKERMIQENTSK